MFVAKVHIFCKRLRLLVNISVAKWNIIRVIIIFALIICSESLSGGPVAQNSNRKYESNNLFAS